jgi:hypothetical protein
MATREYYHLISPGCFTKQSLNLCSNSDFQTIHILYPPVGSINGISSGYTVPIINVYHESKFNYEFGWCRIPGRLMPEAARGQNRSSIEFDVL